MKPLNKKEVMQIIRKEMKRLGHDDNLNLSFIAGTREFGNFALRVIKKMK